MCFVRCVALWGVEVLLRVVRGGILVSSKWLVLC